MEPKLTPKPAHTPAAKPAPPPAAKTEEAKPPAAPASSDSMTITYVGDPNDGGRGPSNSTFAGILMPKGKPVTVNDAAWIKKFGFRFLRSRHFKVG